MDAPRAPFSATMGRLRCSYPKSTTFSHCCRPSPPPLTGRRNGQKLDRVSARPVTRPRAALPVRSTAFRRIYDVFLRVPVLGRFATPARNGYIYFILLCIDALARRTRARTHTHPDETYYTVTHTDAGTRHGVCLFLFPLLRFSLPRLFVGTRVRAPAQPDHALGPPLSAGSSRRRRPSPPHVLRVARAPRSLPSPGGFSADRTWRFRRGPGLRVFPQSFLSDFSRPNVDGAHPAEKFPAFSTAHRQSTGQSFYVRSGSITRQKIDRLEPLVRLDYYLWMFRNVYSQK